jgi:hypothetical protein
MFPVGSVTYVPGLYPLRANPAMELPKRGPTATLGPVLRAALCSSWRTR